MKDSKENTSKNLQIEPVEKRLINGIRTQEICGAIAVQPLSTTVKACFRGSLFPRKDEYILLILP